MTIGILLPIKIVHNIILCSQINHAYQMEGGAIGSSVNSHQLMSVLQFVM